GPAAAHAQRPDLSGHWAFNAAQSDNPRDRTEPGDTSGGAQRAGGGGGRRGGYGGGRRGGFGGGRGERNGGGGGCPTSNARACVRPCSSRFNRPPHSPSRRA